MEKRLFWIAILLAVVWVTVSPGQVLRAQCTGGTYVANITPTLSWQTIPCIRGGEYYRFFATAGVYYTFSFCFAGGSATFDTEISILTDAGVPDPLGFANGGDCGLGDHLWYYTPPSTGWYRVLVTKAPCLTDTRCTTLAYHTELDPYAAPGRTCATPWIAPSIPYTQTGLTTCFYDNNYGSNVSCPSTYMSGEDFVIRFNGTAGQCISIYLNNTFIYTGLFLFNGCPSTGGTTCIAYREGSGANPQMTNITLPTTTTYYLIVDTQGGLVGCTSFDVSILNCVAPGTTGATCATAFTIPSLPYNQVGFTTCGKGNTYNSTMACTSPFMNGEDFVFKYVSPGNECVNINLSMTQPNSAFFVYNGCPSVVGTTCIASRTSAGGNPKLRDIPLTAAGTYYILVSTQPSPTCTPFDFKIERCPPACTFNPNMNNTCGTAQPVSIRINAGVSDTVCGHTSLALTADTSPDLIADFCGSIENNGWFSFVADSTTMTMRIDVTNCLSGFGVQARVFQSSDCINFTPKSNCWNPMQQANGIITATALTVGQTYLLMFDGYNGDDCDLKVYRNNNGLPVVWTGFGATLTAPKTVQIDWSTSTEVNNRGFFVQRGFQKQKGGLDNFEWESIAFVEPAAGAGDGASYRYEDHPDYLGRPWYYRIQQIDFDGTSDYTPYQEIMIAGAAESDLQAVYPNPASRLLNLQYYAAKAGPSEFVIYNIAGARVRQANFSSTTQGVFYETVDISELPNGLYFYVFSVNGKLFKDKLEILH